MSQAEHLLIRTNLTMGQIAQTISRTTSNRFAELFKKARAFCPSSTEASQDAHIHLALPHF